MTHFQNAILRELFTQYQYGKLTYTLPFNKINAELTEIRIALDCLENNNYIEVLSYAIGSAIIKLTDDGLAFCEQTYHVQ